MTEIMQQGKFTVHRFMPNWWVAFGEDLPKCWLDYVLDLAIEEAASDPNA